MEFTTYWSILDTPSHTIKSNIIALIVFLLGAFLWILAKKFKKDSGDGDRKLVLWATSTFSILGLLMYILTIFIYKDNSDKQLEEMLNSSKTAKVEGIISNFQRTYRSHKAGKETTEIFMVDSIKFAYSDALLARFGSFGETYNNVIFNGQYVRITFSPDTNFKVEYHTILKIEIGKTKAMIE